MSAPPVSSTGYGDAAEGIPSSASSSALSSAALRPEPSPSSPSFASATNDDHYDDGDNRVREQASPAAVSDSAVTANAVTAASPAAAAAADSSSNSNGSKSNGKSNSKSGNRSSSRRRAARVNCDLSVVFIRKSTFWWVFCPDALISLCFRKARLTNAVLDLDLDENGSKSGYGNSSSSSSSSSNANNNANRRAVNGSDDDAGQSNILHYQSDSDSDNAVPLSRSGHSRSRSQRRSRHRNDGYDYDYDEDDNSSNNDDEDQEEDGDGKPPCTCNNNTNGSSSSLSSSLSSSGYGSTDGLAAGSAASDDVSACPRHGQSQSRSRAGHHRAAKAKPSGRGSGSGSQRRSRQQSRSRSRSRSHSHRRHHARSGDGGHEGEGEDKGRRADARADSDSDSSDYDSDEDEEEDEFRVFRLIFLVALSAFAGVLNNVMFVKMGHAMVGYPSFLLYFTTLLYVVIYCVWWALRQRANTAAAVKWNRSIGYNDEGTRALTPEELLRNNKNSSSSASPGGGEVENEMMPLLLSSSSSLSGSQNNLLNNINSDDDVGNLNANSSNGAAKANKTVSFTNTPTITELNLKTPLTSANSNSNNNNNNAITTVSNSNANVNIPVATRSCLKPKPLPPSSLAPLLTTGLGRVYLLVGALVTVGGACSQFADPHVSGALQSVINQLTLPLTALFAWMLRGHKFSKVEVIGAAIVVFASVLPLLPLLAQTWSGEATAAVDALLSSASSASDALVSTASAAAATAGHHSSKAAKAAARAAGAVVSGATVSGMDSPFWTFIFLLSDIPSALVNVIEEVAFSAPHHADEIHYLAFTNLLTLFGYASMAPLDRHSPGQLPELAALPTMEIQKLAFQCFFHGNSPDNLPPGCQAGAWAPVIGFVLCIVVYFYVAAVVVKHESAAFQAIANTLVTPLSALAFSSTALVGSHAQELDAFTIAAVVLIPVGIVVYKWEDFGGKGKEEEDILPLIARH